LNPARGKKEKKHLEVRERGATTVSFDYFHRGGEGENGQRKLVVSSESSDWLGGMGGGKLKGMFMSVSKRITLWGGGGEG